MKSSIAFVAVSISFELHFSQLSCRKRKIMKISSIALTALLVAAFLFSAKGQDEEEVKISVMKSHGRAGQRCLFTVVSMRHWISSASCVVWQPVVEGTASTRLFELTPVLPNSVDCSVEGETH